MLNWMYVNLNIFLCPIEILFASYSLQGAKILLVLSPWFGFNRFSDYYQYTRSEILKAVFSLI